MDRELLKQKIIELKKKRNAAILVHNYQRPEIQEIADYLGDSLDLAKYAKQLPNQVIVFCGVHFMAESAVILSPEKTILLPQKDAGCPLADCATPEMVIEARRKNPDAVFVAYINTSAAVKAEVDVVCTSANAFSILSHFKGREICYLPDKNLAAYAEKKLGLGIIKWPGQCYVHHFLIDIKIVRELKKQHPQALVMAHPEATMDVLEMADVVIGTSGMMKIALESDRNDFIIVTEIGLAKRMQREISDKNFYAIPDAVCTQMKLTTLQSLYESLKNMQHAITVPNKIADKARISLQCMLELTK
ncbi:quinolinate synthase NadA [bacterium]|nr:quinolinate synthase NadA [bacterium]